MMMIEEMREPIIKRAASAMVAEGATRSAWCVMSLATVGIGGY
jgi:hypothetical protein